MAKITFNVPAHDRRRKNFTQTGQLFKATIGGKSVKLVHQDNGDIAHYATGGLVLKSNSIKARLLELYVHDPYGKRLTHRQMALHMIADIDGDRFHRVVNAHPILNV